MFGNTSMPFLQLVACFIYGVLYFAYIKSSIPAMNFHSNPSELIMCCH
uniref:Uncharacterized protein n=1 Tax=Arundo donax TaxID=35708 RepID=A0A0A9FXC7_ARUDO